ncbi:hypothetical protein [Streptomyces sp. B21-083]|uniref:hypothetical protein n=1 Tax=Streptomyces sp. B21-083 TaxID=3039410 RepID=UPI002FEF3076
MNRRQGHKVPRKDTCHRSGAAPGERIWRKSSSPWTATIGQTEPIAYRSPAQVKPNRPADSIGHGVSSDGAPKKAITDLLGIHAKTAERWATLADENWSEYLASLK